MIPYMLNMGPVDELWITIRTPTIFLFFIGWARRAGFKWSI